MTATSAMIYRETISAVNQDVRLYAASGDPQAFARLTHRHIDMVYTFCRRQLSGAVLAEDATQAVFILLSQKARLMRPDVILSSWLFEAARRCCANARRSAARRTRHETEAAKLRPATMSTPTSTLEQDEMGQVLHRALGSLRAKDRDVLLLRYFEQQSNRDVSQVLGVTEEAAKTRIVRAVRRLRSIMLRESAATTASGISAGAVVQWLDTDALLHAPADLVHASANLAAGVGAGAATSSSAASIAHAASGALPWSKPLLVVAIVTGVTGVIAGGVLLQMNQATPTSAPVNTAQTIAPAAATAPATAPTGAAVAIDRSTPVECIRSISRCFRDSDLQGLETCIIIRGDDELRAMRTGVRLDMEQPHVERVMREHLGPSARVVQFIAVSPDVMIDQALAALKSADVRVNGDRAVVNLRFSPDMIRKMQLPAVVELFAWPLRLIRDQDGGGGWRLDFYESLSYVALSPDGLAVRVEPKMAAEFFEANLVAVNKIVTETESGRLQDEQYAQELFARTAGDEKIKRNISELTGIAMFPRAFAEQFPKAGG